MQKSLNSSPKRCLSALVAALALVACDAQVAADPELSKESPDAVSKTQPETHPETMPGNMPQAREKAATPKSGLAPMLGTTLDATMQRQVEEARADLLQRLQGQDVDTSDIQLERAERVTWGSAALGCPLPDRGYKMVLVPGVLIQFLVSGTRYEYHGNPSGPPFLCEAPGRVESPAPRRHSLDPT